MGFWLLIGAAVQAVSEVFLVACFGGLIAYKGVFPKSAIKTVDRLVVELFTPCLILSKVIPEAKPQTMAQFWPMMVVCPWNLGWGLLLGFLVSKALGKPGMRGVIQAAVAFPNCISSIVTLAQALSKTKPLQDLAVQEGMIDSSIADDSKAIENVLFSRATVLVMTSTVWWNFARWTVAYSLLSHSSESWKDRMIKVFNPPVVACGIAFVFGFIPPLQAWWTGDHVTAVVIVDSVTKIGTCMVPSVLIVLGARVTHVWLDRQQQKKKVRGPHEDSTELMCNNRIISSPVSPMSSLSSPANPFEINSTSVMDAGMDAGVEGSVQRELANRGEAEEEDQRGGEAEDAEEDITPWALFFIIFARQVVCLLLGLVLTYALLHATRDVMMLLVLYLQTCGPPMINLTVMAGLHGRFEAGLANTLMWAYLLSIISWVVGITLCLSLLRSSL